MNFSNFSNLVNSSKMPSNDPFEGCNFSDSLKDMNVKAYWGQYAVLMPTYFVFGLIGRGLSLLAFYHQAKVEPAYLFQIFAAVIELVEVFAYYFYSQTRYLWSGVSRLGEPWFMKCWLCMWVDAHILNPFQMAAVMCSVMVSLCMTLDRIYALAKPIKYNQNKNRKKQQWVIFIFCIFVASLTAFPDFFYFYPVWIEELGMYKNVYNKPWRNFLLSLINVHMMLRLGFTLCLAGADLVLAILYRMRIMKRAKMANKPEKSESKEMEKVRILFWLTLIQSILSCVSSLGDFTYTVISWLCQVFDMGDVDCISVMIAPFLDGARAVTDMLDFYIVFALMPSFRKMVIKAVKGTFKIGQEKVTDISKSGITGSTMVSKAKAPVFIL